MGGAATGADSGERSGADSGGSSGADSEDTGNRKDFRKTGITH